MSDKKVQELTDDMAAAIWSGSTVTIDNIDEPTDVASDDDNKVIDPKEATPIDEQAVAAALRGDEIEEEEEVVDEAKAKPVAEVKPPVTPKAKPVATPGRKPSDLVTMVNQLVSEEILLGEYDENDKLLEVKTIEEAKALIKANLDEREKAPIEKVWEEKVKSYSPQVQTILRYAEQGAQSATELLELMQTIKEVEDVNEIDVKTKDGQISIIREAYKAKGFKDAYIEKNIKRLEDLDALEEEAQELSQELIQLRANEVKKRLEVQARRKEEAEEASKVYYKTIQDTLSKDAVNGVKLAKEDKAKIYRALVDDRYTSLSGGRTNEFVKTLEDLQFGKSQNYEHFLSIVQFTVDPKGFVEKLKASVKQEVTAETVRKLKSAKDVQANASESENNSAGKRGIKRAGFKNPFE
jgi:hypothetical protein